MKLVDAVRTWLGEDLELKHFYVEHSDHEDFDQDWIVCKCTDHILATIKERSIQVLTIPVDAHMDNVRVRLPTGYDVPAEHPQFFEMVKFSLLRYHTTYGWSRP